MREQICDVPRLMVAAPGSGSGKTTLTCALLGAAQQDGLSPCAIKCGPDYLDPMFHRQVLGIPSCNLDLFFSREEEVRGQLAVHAQGHGLALCEGVMGFYDGAAGGTQASSWHLAQVTQTPVVLVVRPQGAALTYAAMLQGLVQFRQESWIKGILFNGCSPRLVQRLAPLVERETGVPVLGALPLLPSCHIPSRHLGLMRPEELDAWETTQNTLTQQLRREVDVQKLWNLAQSAPKVRGRWGQRSEEWGEGGTIAVAQDPAFCFYYQENWNQLKGQGLNLVCFSPLRDQTLPSGICGLYLGGGYPELYAKGLSENLSMRQSIREALEGGMPALAECGGFLYLQQSLEDENGQAWPMVGLLKGTGAKVARRPHFGYIQVTGGGETPYLKEGETIAAHEFHRWDCSHPGDSCWALRPEGQERWPCIVSYRNVFAGFPHLFFASQVEFVRRFAQTCAQYQRRLM